MTTYTDVFGSQTVPPSGRGYVAVAMTANTTFYWPEQAEGDDLMADIMDITPTAAWTMTLPAANLVSTGRDVLIRNPSAFTLTIVDAAAGAVATVAAGAVKYLDVTDNSTAAGVWSEFTFGTGSSAADAASLAGHGLEAQGSVLSQEWEIKAVTTDYTVVDGDRATTLAFANSGALTCTLLTAAAAGNGFFVSVTNQGSGAVTIDGAGTETIDGETTKARVPGESPTPVSDGISAWVTLGYGRSTAFQFTKLVLDISTGTPFTLTTAQAANKLLQTIGTITGNVVVNLPAVVAIYYVECSHAGAFSTTFKTAAGLGISLDAGDRAILYCDGVDVVLAQTSSAPVSNLSGGAAGEVLYQSAVGATSFVAAGSAGQVLISAGTSSPVWGSLTGGTF